MRDTMDTPNSIDITALRKTIHGIFDFIEKDLGLSAIDLKQNYYWAIPDDVMYTLESAPRTPCRSLYDDWEFVLSSSKNKDQQIPIMFIHIAPLLQALSQLVPSYPHPIHLQRREHFLGISGSPREPPASRAFPAKARAATGA